MSSSRSVAAAQRRRAGPSETQPSRGPNTSIQSSQAFSQQPQIRPGTTGRLAGQQAALAQQQQMQQQQQQSPSALTSASKMTVPQAITLITLRLGRLETQMQNVEGLSLSAGADGMVTAPDETIINGILDRINLLEQKNTETTTLKQQVDILKTAVVSIKNASTIHSKELKEIKPVIEQIHDEMNKLKMQIDDLLLETMVEGALSDAEELDTEVVTEVLEELVPGSENNESNSESETEAESNPLNLKAIIEQELNAT